MSKWTEEKPKQVGLYIRSNPVVQKNLTIQTVFNIDGVLKTFHPHNESGKLIPVSKMPNRFLWLKIPYPDHYKKTEFEIPLPKPPKE